MKAPWNFSDSRRTNLSLDDFLAAKEAAGITFFTGKEPWMKGVNKLTWQTFFRVSSTLPGRDLRLRNKNWEVALVCGPH